MPHTKRVQRRSGVTRYQQLYTLIAEALVDGSIRAGSALPTESALMREHAVSRNTVRRALEKLEREKRIIRRRGSGSYAREQPGGSVTGADVIDIVHDLREIEIATTWRLLYFGSVATPAYVLDRAPAFGPRSLLVQRTRTLRGRIFTLATSYLVDHVGARLNRRRLAKRALFVAVDEIGVKVVTCDQVTSAITANAIVAEQLAVPMGAPLLYVEQISYAEDGSPVEFAEMTYPASLYRPHMTMRLNRSNSDLSWLPVSRNRLSASR
jgi:GntR family transcriptional regulator